MPKVPVTSKRARTVMSQEPLVPESVRALTSSDAIAAPRRSTRHAASTPTAEMPAPSAKKAKPRAVKSTPVVGLPGEAGVEAAAVQLKAEDVKAEAVGEVGDQAQPKKRKRGAAGEGAPKGRGPANGAKAGGGKGGAQLIKTEEVSQDGQGAGSNATPTKKPRKGAAKLQQAGEVEQDTQGIGSDGPPAKKPRARRGPSGYAMVGEDVADSPADRRARLKAAKQSGSDAREVGALPEVLGAEVARMCRELGDESLGRTAPWGREGGAVGGLRWWTGCHTSMSGGMERAVVNAAAIGCRAFAMDTRCKMRWESPPLTEQTITAFKAACQKFGFGPDQILPHGSYLINLASPDPEMAQKGYTGFLTELQRCESLGLSMYNFHPGSTTGKCTHEESMDRIAGFINRALEATKGVTVVLENMSSVGNILGGRPWHLRYIIDRVEDKSRIGFCIDTCHLFSSGLDLRTVEDCEATFKEIDEVVGLQYLKGMHLNDSKTPFDSHRDRHENIGRGSIPMTAFQWIMNNPKFQSIPLIMETPVQEREPPVDYKKSLENGCICWKDGTAPYGVGTDRRDVMLLNSLVKKT